MGFNISGAFRGASNSIEQLLKERYLKDVQEREFQLQQEQAARAMGELKLRQQQEERVTADSKRNFESMETERQYRRAANIAENSLPGDQFDPETAKTLDEAGLGHVFEKKSGAPRMPFLNATEGVPLAAPDVLETRTPGELPRVQEGLPLLETKGPAVGWSEATPDEFTGRGGSKYNAARTAATERAAQAKAAQEAAAERGQANRESREEVARQNRDLKEVIARMSASGSAETRSLANDLKRLQIATAEEKLESTKTAATKQESAARETTQTALDSVKRLLDGKSVGSGIGAATGAYELRGFTQEAQDFNAERDQLVAMLTLPNLGALKGPMSDKDVIFVKQLATKLANTKMSEKETRSELARVKTFLESKMKGSQAQGGSASTKDLGKDW